MCITIIHDQGDYGCLFANSVNQRDEQSIMNTVSREKRVIRPAVYSAVICML